MKFLRKLLNAKSATGHRVAEIVPQSAWGFAAPGLDDYYSSIHETRPYVIAMREVACDSYRFG